MEKDKIKPWVVAKPNPDPLFEKLQDLEEAYIAGHITMDMYLNEYIAEILGN